MWELGASLAGAVGVEDGLEVGRLVEMLRPSLLGAPFSQDSHLLGDAHCISAPTPMSKLLGHPQSQAPEAKTPAGSGGGSEGWKESAPQESIPEGDGEEGNPGGENQQKPGSPRRGRLRQMDICINIKMMNQIPPLSTMNDII